MSMIFAERFFSEQFFCAKERERKSYRKTAAKKARLKGFIVDDDEEDEEEEGEEVKPRTAKVYKNSQEKVYVSRRFRLSDSCQTNIVCSFQSDADEIPLSMKVDHHQNDETLSDVPSSASEITSTKKRKRSEERVRQLL